MEHSDHRIKLNLTDTFVEPNEYDITITKSGTRYFLGVKNWFFELQFLSAITNDVVQIDSLRDTSVDCFVIKGLPNVLFPYMFSDFTRTMLEFHSFLDVTDSLLVFDMSCMTSNSLTARDTHMYTIECLLTHSSGDMQFRYHEKYVDNNGNKASVAVKGISSEDLARFLVFGDK